MKTEMLAAQTMLQEKLANIETQIAGLNERSTQEPAAQTTQPLANDQESLNAFKEELNASNLQMQGKITTMEANFVALQSIVERTATAQSS